MINKRLTILALLIFVVLILSGCADYKEIDETTLIKGIGIDLTEDEQIKYSLQIIQPSPNVSQGESQNGATSSGAVTISVVGETIDEASRKTISLTGRTPYYGHSELIVINEKVAKKGLQKYLDYLVRKHDIRGTSIMVFVKESANKILNSKHVLQKISAIGIQHSVNGMNQMGYNITTDLFQFMTALESKTIDPVGGIISLTKNLSSDKNLPQEILASFGGVIFKGDKLVDWLTPKETRGYNWVKEPKEVKGPVIIQVPGKDKTQKVSIEVKNSATKIRPVIENNKIKMEIKIKSLGFVIENMTPEIQIEDKKFRKFLNKMFRQTVKNEIEKTIQKSKQNGADIFGFAQVLNRKYPKKYQQVSREWDSILKDLEVDILIDAEIMRSHMLK